MQLSACKWAFHVLTFLNVLATRWNYQFYLVGICLLILVYFLEKLCWGKSRISWGCHVLFTIFPGSQKCQANQASGIINLAPCPLDASQSEIGPWPRGYPRFDSWCDKTHRFNSSFYGLLEAAQVNLRSQNIEYILSESIFFLGLTHVLLAWEWRSRQIRSLGNRNGWCWCSSRVMTTDFL